MGAPSRADGGAQAGNPTPPEGRSSAIVAPLRVKLTVPRIAPFSAQTRDHARLALLVLVAIEVFVLPSLLAAGVVTALHLDIATSLTLIAGIVAVSERLTIAVVAGTLSALAFAARLIASSDPTVVNQVTASVFTMLVTGLFTALILFYVFGKERSTLHRMVGAIAAYLLIAVIFGRAYQVIWFVHPESLNLGVDRGSYNDILYFSFATLTTLGFGTPVGPFARALVSMEALVGQLYPAILIARLVSLPSSNRHGPHAS